MITPEDEKALETGTKAVASEAFRPFADLIAKIFGPTAEAIGLGLGAAFRSWSIKRQVRFWKKTQEYLAEAGVEPLSVPPKILLPIIQNASIEDDDSLQDRWAALLANAANPNQNPPIMATYADILRRLSPKSAAFLDVLFDEYLAKIKRLGRPERWSTKYTDEIYSEAVLYELYTEKIDPDGAHRHVFTTGNLEYHSDFLLTIENLTSLGIIESRDPRSSAEGIDYFFTMLGLSFVRACRALKK